MPEFIVADDPFRLSVGIVTLIVLLSLQLALLIAVPLWARDRGRVAFRWLVASVLLSPPLAAFLLWWLERRKAEPAVAEHAEEDHDAAYTNVFFWLAILAAAKVILTYQPVPHAWVIPILLALAAIKVALVVLYYMHLKFDSRVYAAIFGIPMAIGLAISVFFMMT